MTSGYRTRPIFAIRAGATGDISLADDESSNQHVAWSSPRDGPYIASPLVYRGYLYVVSANGVLTVFDAITGERTYRRRIGDTGGAYSASPIAADDRLYLTSKDGDIFVVRAGPEYELLATNRMGEVCLATPAISEGQIFIRTTNHLLAVTDGIAPAVAAAEESSLTPFSRRAGRRRGASFRQLRRRRPVRQHGRSLANVHQRRIRGIPKAG